MVFDFTDLIIFEMANNHQGSIDHGLRIIEEMAIITRRYGIRSAIKLQYRDLDTFIHPDYINQKDVKHIPRFLGTRLDWSELQTLVLATLDHRMVSVVTPFDEKSVEMALNHGVDILKVASCSCMDWPLLEVMAHSGKPIICSTGGCTLSDIDKISTFFEHRSVSDLALLHCIGIYPTEDKDQQLGFMRHMMLRYPHCAIGYSGHESPDNLRIAVAAVAMGAQILERHIGVPTEDIKLNAYSMNPGQVEQWVQEILAARQICGQKAGGEKRLSESEQSSLRSLARGVFARNAIREGAPLSAEKVFFAMPCSDGQTTTKEYLETLKASKNYNPLAPIEEKRSYDPIQIVRGVVHEAKGLLREAHISIGSEYEIELSHHHGMDNFRRIGAVIINFINREYCKKLIILLPGQFHPSHAHTKKEETFQVIYGELNLTLNGISRIMSPGDIQLVLRGDYHSFSTKTGVIFEEISTTHIKGDSTYEDAKINKLDPILRKTVPESW